MSKRAEASGISLTETDATFVKGMLARGDRQHDIAAWFGVNGGRVAEIASGAKFWWVDPADEALLPPAGPYPCGLEAHAAMEALEAAKRAVAEAGEIVRVYSKRAA